MLDSDDLVFGSCYDKLGFEPFACRLVEIVESVDALKRDKGFVISLDSSWGTGKTTFLKMFMNKIQKMNGRIKTIYYNAWENDDFDDPLIPLIYSLEEKGYVKKASLSKLVATGSKSALKSIVSSVTINLPLVSISGDELAKGIEKIKKTCDEAVDLSNKQIYQKYQQHIKNKEEFKSILSSLPIFHNDIVVILVDELDRCKPVYAIETLELIKHLFNIDNIVFIIALDFNQLSHSISTLYGQNMDSAGYLRRMFNIQLSFPHINVMYFIMMHLYRDNRGNEKIIQLEKNENLVIYLRDISEYYKLSLRDIESLIFNMKLLLSTSLKKYDNDESEFIIEEIFAFYFMILVFKVKFPVVWEKMIKQKVPYKDKPYNDEEKYLFDIVKTSNCPSIIKTLVSIFENNQQFITVEAIRAGKAFTHVDKRKKLDGTIMEKERAIFNTEGKHMYMSLLEMIKDDIALLDK